ncbi:MAG: CRISPR-associated helicase Cas3' [Desulfurococcales archaeon]|nr:CRISPR-associated helicase Cas3' [Desulfurococcales archaeon]
MARLRPAMEAAWEALERGEIPIVLAPTGYGKTRASPEIYDRARKAGLAAGLIHVAPLRALVRSVFWDHFSRFGADAGFQSGDGLAGGYKSPYYLRRLVVTTLESYFWNVFKLPVVEYAKIAAGSSQGHYYPVLASIVSYVNVFDEAHMYLDASREASSALMLAAISFLAGYKVPLMIESATIHSSLVRDLVRRLGMMGSRVRVVMLEGSGMWVSRVKVAGGGRRYAAVEAVDDRDFTDDHSIDWKTEVMGYELEKVLAQACHDAESGLRVMVALNTVPRAIAAYRYLAETLGCNPVLVHGRLSEGDKEKAMKGAANANLIVSTQVIEAGVDVNAHVLYTEAAPIESLAQRAGRLCRRGKVLEDCRSSSEAGRVAVLGGPLDSPSPYSEGVLRKVVSGLKSVAAEGVLVEWRLPLSERGKVSYADLIEDMSEFKNGFPGSMIAIVREFRQILAAEPSPGYIINLLDRLNLCSLTGSSIQAKVLVGPNPREDYVNLDFGVIARRWDGFKSVLTNDKGLIEIAFASEEKTCEARELTRYLDQLEAGKVYCRKLAELLRRDLRSCGVKGYLGDFYIKAREGAYLEGLGLSVDVDASRRVIE